VYDPIGWVIPLCPLCCCEIQLDSEVFHRVLLQSGSKLLSCGRPTLGYLLRAAGTHHEGGLCLSDHRTDSKCPIRVLFEAALHRLFSSGPLRTRGSLALDRALLTFLSLLPL
jgi:hypothetical protein